MRESSIALNRFGLGGRQNENVPTEPKRWLLDQLARFEPRPAEIAALPGTKALIPELREAYDERKLRKAIAEDAKDPNRRDDPLPSTFKGMRSHYLNAVNARAAVALTSETPFLERLVHFWSNHFAVSIDKITVIGVAGAFEFEAIRPHLLGRFSDMLGAALRHAAMLLYLDQAQSVGPESMLGTRANRRGRERGLNENLAREVLELHTLGVRSGYSQADVTELARALTGWTVGGLAQNPLMRGPGYGFWFAAGIHQPGTRTILGKRYAQEGEAQAQAVLDDLAVHPATARHIATKLARHFAADEPPPALVARLEKAFLASRGDLPTLYRVLTEAPEVWNGAPKFRTPWEWSIAALRATGVPALSEIAAAATFQQLGQPVWRPGSPAGYNDTAASWAGPDALFRRIEAAERIAKRTAARIDARKLAERLFPAVLSETTSSALARAESGTQALALLLASPEMMRR